ncbi:MAG TPA: hypothetical protein VFV41_18495, partial [Streptosporangiaceae bacterium]|nr:hypothetical protein [Streptosporangiaceae bacterium]
RIDVVLEPAAGPEAAASPGVAGDLEAAAAVLAQWATGPASTDPDQRRLSVPVAAGAVTLPELVRQLEAAGLRARDVSVRRPTLDEVFLDRTGAAAGQAAGQEVAA